MTTTLTDKQASFIKRLLDERLDPTDPKDAEWRTDVLSTVEAGAVSKKHASEVIDYLLGRKPIVIKTDGDVAITTHAVPNGTYTLVPRGDEEHVTLRVRSADWAKDLPAGSQVVEFLSGPDNTVDYTGFGFVVKGRPRVWKRFDQEGRPARALRALLALEDEAVQEAGFAYALESGRCYRCNRTLTVPASIHRGLGPVCAGVIDGSE